MGKLTYAEAGVSIDKGDEFVRRIAPLAKSTYTPRVLAGVGGFAGYFALDYDATRKLFSRGYKQPILVASTDGVGTKLDVAQMAGVHNTVGIDLVAMSVNDILVARSRFFFLDYIACGKLNVDIATDVVKGIVEGCNQAQCVLLGGETAEHPGSMRKEQYDLAGFAVGVVEKRKIIDGRDIEAGDVVLGLASTGLHSNGYSLARKIIFDVEKLKVHDVIPELGVTVAQALLVPTRIYVNAIRSTMRQYKVKKVINGMAHITGGGFTENIPRVLPTGMSVEITRGSWPVPAIFQWLGEKGDVDEEEMYRVFNMGVGMAVIVSKYYAEAVRERLVKAGERVYKIGRVVRTPGRKEVIYKEK